MNEGEKKCCDLPNGERICVLPKLEKDYQEIKDSLEDIKNNMATKSDLIPITQSLTNIGNNVQLQSGTIGRIEDKVDDLTTSSLPEIRGNLATLNESMATKSDINELKEDLKKSLE